MAKRAGIMAQGAGVLAQVSLMPPAGVIHRAVWLLILLWRVTLGGGVRGEGSGRGGLGVSRGLDGWDCEGMGRGSCRGGQWVG